MKINISAMNAYIGSKEDLDRENWIFEPKLDGFRALAYINKKINLISRNNLSLYERFPELLHFRKFIKAKTCILDGEIVAFDKNGNPNFELLQQGYECHYIIFDILMKDGQSLIDKPLIERKKILEKTVTDGENIEKIFFTTDGHGLWKVIIAKGVEGVMAKDENAKYYPGKRTRVWLKVKQLNTIDSVIIGYVSKKRTISSLALGLYNSQKKLVYIGDVGTGFSYNLLQELNEKLSKIEIEKPEIVNLKSTKRKKIHWVKAKLVCEVKFLEFTSKEKILRHSSFVRLRTDKKPQQCTVQSQMP